MRKNSVWTIAVVLAVGLCFMAGQVGAAEGSKPVTLAEQETIGIKIGDPVDAAPFGEYRTWDNGKDIGVLWEDARDILKVVVRFAAGAAPTDPASVKLQYWQSQWPQRRIPRDKVAGSGGSGWLNVGDWYNGKWKDADVELATDDATWTYTFKPVNEKEFPGLNDFDAKYRSTLKLRLLFPDQAPPVAAFHTFTDSTWDQAEAAVMWGGTAVSEQIWDGKPEVFNGQVAGISALEGCKAVITDNSWTSTVNGNLDGVRLSFFYAKPAAAVSFDETVVTIRAKQHSFSFLARDIAEGKHIFIRDYGVLVKPIKDTTTYAQAEEAYQKSPKSLHDRISDLPEQTLDRTWSAMPQKGRIYMPLAVEGGRQHFGINPNGDIRLDRDWQRRVKGADTDRTKWGNNIDIRFGLSGDKTGASIEDGYLPITTTWYERDGVRYTEDAFATTLNGVLPKDGRVKGEEPQVLMVRFRLTNYTNSTQKAVLPIEVRTDGKIEPPAESSGLISGKTADGERLRLYVNANNTSLNIRGNQAVCEAYIPAGATKEIYVNIPFETLELPAEAQQLTKLQFDEQYKMISDYWRKRMAQSCQIVTPEPMINSFYSANSSHQLINTENEVGTDERAMAKVGTFSYGVYTNESVMMTSDIDRRGYKDVAEKAYESWIHYQGTARLPGDYTNADGVFYGVNGYQAGGYNQHHGWALWGMGEHYWFTRDDAWLNRAAPSIIKACEWIINQRTRTKTDECVGIRAIEYGLLPPGSLEDIGDWRVWMSNNVFSWWGMDNAARALSAIGHPQATWLLNEAADYKKDIRNAFLEAMVRSPVVPLRDGTYVPSIPSEVHRRGRSFGWITETLEGSIHMLRCGVIAPDEPAALWIMRDYEDNRYTSDQFGYQIPFFDRDWFNLGGFSQQPSLLCSPTPYLLLDEPKQYLRAYFNAFAAGYFPERAMLTEHPLPALGNYAGDHFKSSDEAMNTSWIRWMFVWDEGEDLYLGKVMPRYWLEDGKQVKIERAQTHFGQMSMSMKSYAKSGRIEMTIEPPTRNAPRAIYARFRHPDGKNMNRVTVNGKPWSKFDPVKEWVVLPPFKEKTVVVAYYD